MLTRSGLGLGVAVVVLAVCGWWWGYEELLVVAAGAAVAIGIAVWSARAAVRTTTERAIAAPRIARGDPIRAVYRTTNPSRRRSAPMSLVDTCGDAEVRIEIPPVDGLDRTERLGLIPTRRRGVFDVGPWTVERIDPLGLFELLLWCFCQFSTHRIKQFDTLVASAARQDVKVVIVMPHHNG